MADPRRRQGDWRGDEVEIWLVRSGRYRFPREVIAIAVRWYLRYGLSLPRCRKLLAERGITVDHVTVYRWVQTFTPEFIAAARPARRAAGDRWFVDETYVKGAGRWSYLYRAVDQHGQVIDVLVSTRRDAAAAQHFFTRALRCGPAPVEVMTDRAPVYPRALDELVPAARHVTDRYQNNVVEADHGRLKARLRPMRGLKRLRSAGSSRPGTRSCRTCAADTTHSPPTCQSVIASASRSMSSRYCSDLVETSGECGSGSPTCTNATVPAQRPTSVQRLRRGELRRDCRVRAARKSAGRWPLARAVRLQQSKNDGEVSMPLRTRHRAQEPVRYDLAVEGCAFRVPALCVACGAPSVQPEPVPTWFEPGKDEQRRQEHFLNGIQHVVLCGTSRSSVTLTFPLCLEHSHLAPPWYVRRELTKAERKQLSRLVAESVTAKMEQHGAAFAARSRIQLTFTSETFAKAFAQLNARPIRRALEVRA